MNDGEYVRRRIALLRPRAKFIAYSHSDTFIDEAAGLGSGFHYVSLYDEKIDSNVIASPRGLIMIHNTYLPSFAYNLFLCWLLCAGRTDGDQEAPKLETLLRHNFKKFFAEQLLHVNNNIFSRAIFLETLLFEQVCMVPVFEVKSRDADLDRKADFGARLMSSAVSFHELAHFFLKHGDQEWNGLLEENAGVLDGMYRRVNATYPPAFVVEVKCDVMSVLSCLRQYEAEMSREFCLRTLVFAFAAFAILSSLAKSADKTASDQSKSPDSVDFNSIAKLHRDYNYTIGFDKDLTERARLVSELCGQIAQKEGLSLFEKRGEFPLPVNIIDSMLTYVDRVMESDDNNARSMSLLVAEALHEHPRGLEFLYLRSKTFTTHAERELPANPQ
jgi:hypothetical protein